MDGESREQEREGSDAPDEKMSMTDLDTQDPASLSDDKSLGTKQIQHRCVKTYSGCFQYTGHMII